ncbi:zinc-containing alcohol dehydrogenase [Cavenderia fasciculata]|uniref:Zinc-containing alcohol dehydrogenase n=1 Tax=Cavenderia fasciculata TaxID=261658 RepID=F4Q196_CACFS|nr:zinc-containing alcohol dehydrogenase [Cavenderia fasciculata]EGG18597.1 zinc-containing alcohol dehydrogenase [Cavenderia fasciculata]|eukprot:XP_004366501.1 zinc-containing alcohol dehydrogenase [Cavenderia fasciculata]
MVEGKRILLVSRPRGEPTPENFKLETHTYAKPGPDQMLLKVLYLSIEYLRGRMNESKESYVPRVEIGDVMGGGTVAKVLESNLPKFKVGDLVLSPSGWQEYEVSSGKDCIVIPAAAAENPSRALGILGMPSFTAWAGTLKIGAPKQGETLVVAAATGAVGSVVGQIAKLQGLRVVGIAGGAKKCEYAVKEFGFDVCLDHTKDDLAQKLKEACPKGIDIYFENVGGKVFQAVLPLLNIGARIPLCGIISGYSATELPAGPDRTPLVQGTFLTKSVTNFGHLYGEFIKEMSPWAKEGKVKMLEDVRTGIETAPAGLIGILKGDNFGKLIIKF